MVDVRVTYFGVNVHGFGGDVGGIDTIDVDSAGLELRCYPHYVLHWEVLSGVVFNLQYISLESYKS